MQFDENLSSGLDLEAALADIVFCPEIIDDIRRVTWEIISKSDLELFYRIIFNQEQIPLSRLIKFFYQPHPQCVNIITTNYDRVIEYACDAGRIPVYTGLSQSSNYIAMRLTNADDQNVIKNCCLIA